jgi:DNA replication protein DnaC
MRNLSDAIPNLTLVGDVGAWSDEQWDAHDRRVAEERAREAANDRAREIAQARATLEDNGFPVRALDVASTADLKQSALVAIADWKPADDSILVLSGRAGCGKSVAATWWAARCCPDAKFVRATEFASSSRYQNPKREAWYAASGLVLDDLGTEHADAKGSFLVDLDELIDRFYGAKRPLVITTNVDAKAFKQRYGARIEDRIRECGRFVSLSAPSLRKPRAKGDE